MLQLGYNGADGLGGLVLSNLQIVYVIFCSLVLGGGMFSYHWSKQLKRSSRSKPESTEQSSFDSDSLFSVGQLPLGSSALAWEPKVGQALDLDAGSLTIETAPDRPFSLLDKLRPVRNPKREEFEP